MSKVDVTRAREMRAEGQTLKAIGDHFGVTRERIRQLVGSPPREKVCERCGDTFATGIASRRFCSGQCAIAAARARRGVCACGAPKSATASLCWNCRRAEDERARTARRRLISELWAEGLSAEDIAARAGLANTNHLGVEMARMRNTGWDLPPRRDGWYGFSRPTGVPAQAPTTPVQARQQLAHAIKNGRIRRPARCERCGQVGWVDGHHSDYTKPLYVEWLCRQCHSAHHAQERRAA